ncbi:apolipoprotein N-acyltransferase [Candidatus Latescibacterota bacterium]
MSKKTAFICTLISAIILGCAYPPVGLGFLAYVGLIPMIFVLRSMTTRQVLLWSFVMGLIFHVITVSWIRHITWIGMVFSVIALSFFYTLPFIFSKPIIKIYPKKGILLFPFAVAGFEWIRSFDVLAFPWMILGNSQTYYPRLIQFADITSAYGVSFWVAMINVSVYFLIMRRTFSRWIFLVLLFVLPFMYSWAVINAGQDGTKKITVALIQGNVFPDQKWGLGKQFWNLQLYEDMSIEAMAEHPDLIVWPETATPVYLLETASFRHMVQSLVDSINVPILTGTPSIDYKSEKKWNSAAYFLPGQFEVERYDKINLVPFGESIPFNSIFPALNKIQLGQANWDKGSKPVVFSSPELPPFNVAVCFESIFPDLIRKFVIRGSRFIVVITNDVWFGPYSSPIQHAMISSLRAIEFHLPVVRCANTGISMVIDRYGRVTDKTKTFERDILIGDITPGTKKTVYARFGNIFSLFCLVISLASNIFYIKIKYFKFGKSVNK